MKTIVICGDSWMSPVKGPGKKKFEGTHFSEIIAKKLNYNLISYAMSGMSTGGICIQIETALKLNPKPDLILVNTTTSNRFEWPINEVTKIDDLSVYDLQYVKTESTSYYNEGINEHPKLITHSIDYIVESQKYIWQIKDKYAKERLEALTQYLTWLYHPDFKDFQDKCMMYGMFRKIHDCNIPYLIMMDNPNLVARTAPWILPKNYASHDVNSLNFGHNDPDWEDPGYHTTIECQQEIADILLKKYIPGLLHD